MAIPYIVALTDWVTKLAGNFKESCYLKRHASQSG
jgi:hypothetical protein